LEQGQDDGQADEQHKQPADWRNAKGTFLLICIKLNNRGRPVKIYLKKIESDQTIV